MEKTVKYEMFLRRVFSSSQIARDMTFFVDTAAMSGFPLN
jgi:hypothetical protein